MQLAWIGLGVMGGPMAGHLSKHRAYDLTVYNRSPQPGSNWLKTYKGTLVKTPKDAAAGADIVFSCVGRDEDVFEIAFGDQGAFHSMKPGSIFVDHTTISAKSAVHLAQKGKQFGVHVLDAPVSGGQSGAENGALSIMVGGNKSIYETTVPVMKAYGKTLAHIGGSGHGQMAKMVNQIAIAGLLQGLSEAIYFAQSADLDLESIMSVIQNGAAGSWQMTNRWQTMARGEFDHGFAVDLMRKDLSICLNEAETLGLDLPITKLVDGFYKQLADEGYGHYDTSSLINLLHPSKDKKTNAPLPLKDKV